MHGLPAERALAVQDRPRAERVSAVQWDGMIQDVKNAHGRLSNHGLWNHDGAANSHFPTSGWLSLVRMDRALKHHYRSGVKNYLSMCLDSMSVRYDFQCAFGLPLPVAVVEQRLGDGRSFEVQLIAFTIVESEMGLIFLIGWIMSFLMF